MTPEDLRAWRKERFQPGTKTPLSQSHAAKLVRAAGGYRTWQRWERGHNKIPPYLPLLLQLLDYRNGWKREITPQTWTFATGEEL